MTLVFFEPGMRPVLKDRSAAGRKAALARWGNRSGGGKSVTADDIANAFEGTYTTDKGVTFQLKATTRGEENGLPTAGGDILSADGGVIGEWARSVDNESGTMNAVFLSVGVPFRRPRLDGESSSRPESSDLAEFRRAGIALEVQKATERAARDLGLETIKVSAEDQGSAAWANERFGYSFAAKPSLRGISYAISKDFPPEVAAKAQDFVDRFKSDDRSRWPSPHEVLTMGGADGGPRIGGDIYEGRTYGEFALSWGWSGEKPSTHVTKAAGMISLIVEGSDPVEKADRSAAGRKAAEARWGNRGLGIAREDMPQIPKKNRDKFFAQLKAEGVEYHDETVDPRTLKQTQAGLNPKQTKVLLDAMREGSFRGDTHTIIAARDGHILDGHHRWDAARKYAAEGGEADIRITRVDMPIRELLDRAAKFNAEEGIEARGMETVSTFNKAVTITFAPGLRPVLKGSRTEAARYAASVRWRDAKATASATASVMTSPHRSNFADTLEERNEAFYRAIRYNDFSGYEIGSSKLARRIGGGIGRLERKLDQFRKRKGWKKETIISNEDARKLREDYERRYRS